VAKKSNNELSDFINGEITKQQAKDLCISRNDLLKFMIAWRNQLYPTSQTVDEKSKSSEATKEGKEETSTPKAVEPTAPNEAAKTAASPVTVNSDSSESSSAASSDEDDSLTDLGIEFASIGIAELQGMILKKESFKAIRRLVLANTRPRKAMSAAKMHLPSGLARTDRTLESCVDQTYLALAAIEGGQTDIARLLLNNMAANLEVERRAAIAAALGVEDEATDISRDGRTDLFSFEERERLPSFRDQNKSRKKQPKKAKAKPSSDRSFRPSTDSKNGRKASGGDRKGSRHQAGE